MYEWCMYYICLLYCKTKYCSLLTNSNKLKTRQQFWTVATVGNTIKQKGIYIVQTGRRQQRSHVIANQQQFPIKVQTIIWCDNRSTQRIVNSNQYLFQQTHAHERAQFYTMYLYCWRYKVIKYYLNLFTRSLISLQIYLLATDIFIRLDNIVLPVKKLHFYWWSDLYGTRVCDLFIKVAEGLRRVSLLCLRVNL